MKKEVFHMRCRKSRRLIAEDIWGTITPAQKDALDAHLRSCKDCAAERKQIGTLLDGMSQQKEHEPGEAYWNSFNERAFVRISARQREAPWMMSMPVRMRIALVSMTVVLFIVAVLSFSLFVMKSTQSPSQYEAQLLEAMQAAGAEGTSDLAESVVPFYHDESVYSSVLDPFLARSQGEPDSEHVSSDGLVPYSLIEDLDYSEREALQTEIESEMI